MEKSPKNKKVQLVVAVEQTIDKKKSKTSALLESKKNTSSKKTKEVKDKTIKPKVTEEKKSADSGAGKKNNVKQALHSSSATKSKPRLKKKKLEKSSDKKVVTSSSKRKSVHIVSKDLVTIPETEDDMSPLELPIKFKKIKIEEVVLPKFKNKNVLRYNPPHIQSILDKKEEEQVTNVLVRYSDVELEEFKEVILKKLEEARAELLYIQKLLSGRESNATGDYMHNMMEDVNANIEQETLMQRARRQASFIDNLEKALVRIENKTYGICRMTGKLIEKGRLLAVPHATLCLEAKANAIAKKSN